ncbi:MAG: carboxypeptidase-like regulatory domain-containing protein, partial [Bryobacteraceae bacterium]|nr:carboxypeptidase-like regulatory domain-containing protein [Bryobacteraceae bacterium]
MKPMCRTAVLALAALVAGSAPAGQAAELRLFGAISGQVRNGAGVGQMGAAVVVLNRAERVVQRALTGPDGWFRFEALPPDTYTVRVTLASFVPAVRNHIVVRPGVESFLNIQLAQLFSSIELVYIPPGQTGLLSEDWKWALRSSTSTRPVLRLLPQQPPWQTASSRKHGSPFSAVRGMVRLSGGDGSLSPTLGSEPDLGTAFALATSLFGNNEVRFSGNVGYASTSGTPTAGFRTSYSREGEGLAPSPEVELTVRQAALRQARAGFVHGQGAPVETPVLRTMSVRVGDRMELAPGLQLTYGTMLESVVFIDRLNLLSPYAKLTWDLGEMGVIEGGFASGAPAYELIAGEDTFEQSLSGLALFPRVSLRGGAARVQRSQSFELGYRKSAGTRTYAAAVFQDALRDAALAASGSAFLGGSELLPDLASSSYIFNIGDYRSFGYMASVTQQLWEAWTAGFAAGAASMLAYDAGTLAQSAASVRAGVHPVRRPWASLRVSGIVPGSGT